jgi:putative tryptophan/tyrosine transport system substrate-binding protein
MSKISSYIVPLAIFFLSISGNSQTPKKICRIAYFEAGSYLVQKAMLNELRDNLELLAGDSIDIQFLPDAYLSAEWKRDISKAMAGDLAKNKIVDLVIAAGPWVVGDLLEAGFKKPIVAIGQFDPEIMGLCDSLGRPIASNLTVNYSPNKIKNDIAALEKVFPSRKIGLLYFPSGDESEKLRDRVYAAAGQFGATVHTAKEFTPAGKYTFFNSFGKINRQIDALYLPALWGMELDQIKQFFYETQNARIPTFVAEGILLVEKDGVAANCLRPYKSMARFSAYKIIKIISGAVPASLPTRLDEFEELCLNLDAASKVGVSFPRKVLNEAKLLPVLPADTVATYSLPRALEQAQAENAGFQANRLIYDRAVAEAKNAYIGFYPRVDLNMSAASTDNETAVTHFEPFLNRESQVGMTVEQKLFSFPALKAVQIARKNMALKDVDRHQAEMDLKQSVVAAYLSVMEKEDLVAGYEEIMDRLRDIRDYSATSVKLGLADSSELPLVEERLVKIKIGLFSARSDLRISRVIFNVLVNRPGDYNFLLDRGEFTPEVMAAMVRKLEDYIATEAKEKKFEQYLLDVGVRNSTAMAMADLNLGIQRDLLSRNKGRYLPELSLLARYSYGHQFSPAVSDENHYWIFGGLLKFPLFPGDRPHSSKALQIGMDEILYKKDAARYEKMRDVLSRKNELANLMSTLPLDYFARNVSSLNLDAARQEYNAGKLSLRELLTQEESNAALAVSTVEDRYHFFLTYAELLYSCGVGYLIHSTPQENDFYRNLENYLK